MLDIHRYGCMLCFCVFFFKQKTAYEVRISDWSSDVCSSDLRGVGADDDRVIAADIAEAMRRTAFEVIAIARAEYAHLLAHGNQLGRASCRERVCQYV